MALQTVLLDSFTTGSAVQLRNHVSDNGVAWSSPLHGTNGLDVAMVGGGGVYSQGASQTNDCLAIHATPLTNRAFEILATVRVQPAHNYDYATVNIRPHSPSALNQSNAAGIILTSPDWNVTPANRTIRAVCGESSGIYNLPTRGPQEVEILIRCIQGGSGEQGWKLQYYVNNVLAYEELDPVTVNYDTGDIVHQYAGLSLQGVSSVLSMEVAVEDGEVIAPDAFWMNLVRAAETP